jgi:FKBP-type peptidyl-prolyl cis-trans isomerase (trigger factor)
VVSGRVELDDPELKPIELKDERVDLSPWSSQPQELTRVFLGRKAGDSVKETVPYPVSLKTGETVPARMSCTVTSVLGREIPDIDDELARDYDFKNLDDMRAEIRKQLEQDAHQGWVNESAEKVIEALIGKFDVPLPRSYRQMVEDRVNAGAAPAAGAGEERTEKSRDDLKAEYEKEFKRLILTQVIAMKNNLQISAEDLQRSIESVSGLLQRMNMEETKRREFMRNWLREYETAQFFKIVNGFMVDRVMEAGKKKGPGSPPGARAGGAGSKAEAENESNQKERRT